MHLWIILKILIVTLNVIYFIMHGVHRGTLRKGKMMKEKYSLIDPKEMPNYKF